MLDPDDVSGGRPWAQASLRIASEDLTADAISDRLGLRPTTKRLAEGEPSFTVWTLDSGLDASAELGDHLYFLVERLADCRVGLVEIAESATVEIWLSYSPGAGSSRSSVFGNDLLVQVAALGADLVLDPYPAGGKRKAPSTD